jgi:hypothetical protein
MFYVSMTIQYEARKNMKSVVLHFSIGFPIYAQISMLFCYFWYRVIYMFKCYENFMVAYWEHMLAAVIFVDLTVHF